MKTFCAMRTLRPTLAPNRRRSGGLRRPGKSNDCMPAIATFSATI